MQISDDIFLGPAVAGGPFAEPTNPAPMERGVGPLGRVYVFDVVPVASGTALLAALQTTGGAANLALAAGVGVTARTRSDGTIEYVLDVPRSISLTSAGNVSAVSFTIFGFDQYGQPLSQLLGGPNISTVSTLKTFRSITRVFAGNAVGSATSVGFTDRLGLPVRVTDAGYVISVKWAGVVTQDAGTFSAADVTAPATTTTGDVRGVYLPSSAANGARRLVMAIAVPAIACGPQATRIGAFGVTQA